MTCCFFLIFLLHHSVIFLLCAPFLLPDWYLLPHFIESPIFAGEDFVEACWLLSSPAQTRWDLWRPLYHNWSRYVVIAFPAFWTLRLYYCLKNNNKARASFDTHSSFTFLGRTLGRVQLFAAEVTLRKHSCSSTIWCHRRTTPLLLIFNKDKTLISHLQAVGPWQLLERGEEINSSGRFFGVIYRASLSVRPGVATDEESLCPYHWAVSER